jgi:D-alanyl-D-alanine carboxypeptidase/D-alanyl-D-alanine-endopeptidase (penicillin-binding protein 4)
VPPLSPAVAGLAAEVDSALADPAYERASWGVVVQSLDNGQVLYRRNARRLFLPASNLKILTAAAALARLGPDFRYRTTVLGRGARLDDTLSGDLLVVGGGDPTLVLDTTQGAPDPLGALRPWADSLTARGIRVVRGRVVGDATRFPGPGLGPGWAWDDLDAEYSAPVGALQFDESVAYLLATPGASPGDPVRVTLLPRSSPLHVFSTATTAPRDSAAARLHWGRAPFADSVGLSGMLPGGHDTTRLPVSVPDPARFFETSLTEALTGRGIAVLGDTTTADSSTATPGPASPESLFTWSSPPLSAILPLFLKPSQNQIGETLLRTLGAELTGSGSPDSGRAVVGRVMDGFGVPPDSYVMADGSGLSRYDQVAPEAIARVLAAMRARPDFQVFYDALPVAGVDGTLANRLKGTAAAGNAHAKTGSLTGVRNLSGYVTSADGEHLLFVLMANSFTTPQRVVDATQDQIVERLANFHREVGGR